MSSTKAHTVGYGYLPAWVGPWPSRLNHRPPENSAGSMRSLCLMAPSPRMARPSKRAAASEKCRMELRSQWAEGPWSQQHPCPQLYPTPTALLQQHQGTLAEGGLGHVPPVHELL